MADPAAPLAPRSEARLSPVRADLAQLLKLSGPVVLARLGIMTMGLMDAIVVGRYSAEQLGFHAMAWAPTSVILTMAIGLLTGVQVMTARAVGEGRRDESGAVLRRGLVYGGWIGLASMLVLVVAAPWGLSRVGLEPSLAAGSTGPVIIFALSLPTYVVACAASFWLEGLSRPGPAMVIMWLANIVNLAFLLVLVPGAFGLPALGAVGAAWATFAARAFLAATLLIYIARMTDSKALGVFTKPARDRAAAAEQRKIGYGAGASNFFEVAAFASLNVVAGWIGTLALAAWTVVLNVISMVFMAPLGLATATAVLVSSAYGARDRSAVLRAGLLGFAVTAVFGVVVSLLIWPAAPWIAAAYTTDPQVISVAAAALALSCLFLLADGLQVVIAQALRARGDVWMPTFTHLTSYVVIMMPLAWWLALPMGMGVTGLVWAVILASLVSVGLLAVRFWRLSRQPL
ncbi:MAG: MATE family efflux transporter [Phenylobacterium sp.]|uniref:MATE family efflux transporter n=1 Tax=Phenylobacterium sp. TaxID=1871053 RepID=UPI002719BD2D|nr:MATE family efflux transporter [Phenylobacterium sp.]MDO8902787.1 MATE family efflux transporter [Phenylobacterium sp.]